ncbi:33163_t:CDS:2 [Racocetra persica]|uniref:33163_t:CDS:1 n=1 Tax=Racocetra persica TaxID=160502 RepID=A0ACA9NA77_9GLOM|nr:33163_t:CDS:2 [Racocetra persica]
MFKTGRPSSNKPQQKYIHKPRRGNGETTPIELNYARNSSSNYKHEKNRQKGNCFKCGLPRYYTKNCKSKNKSKLTNIEEKAKPTSHNITNNSLKLTQVEENHKQLLRFKTIEVQADPQNIYKEHNCNSVFISWQQLAKVPSSEEIYTIHVNKKDNRNTSHPPPEVQKILQDFKEIFPETLPDYLHLEQNIDHTINLASDKWKGILKGRIKIGNSSKQGVKNTTTL